MKQLCLTNRKELNQNDLLGLKALKKCVNRLTWAVVATILMLPLNLHSQDIQVSTMSEKTKYALDEAEKFIKKDNYAVLKVAVSQADEGHKSSLILKGGTDYRIYLFSSDKSGKVVFSILDADKTAVIPDFKITPNQYSFVDFTPSSSQFFHFVFSNSSKGEIIAYMLALKKEGYTNVLKAEQSGSIARDSVALLIVDEMPQFMKDKDITFESWIIDNLTYPEGFKKGEIKGKVYVTFVVNKNGTVNKIKIIKGLNPQIDAAILNTIKNSPTWFKPGRNKNKAEDVAFTIPIVLK